jgi:transposase
MPPAYVKPYVKRHKNDAADAEAICEAVTRANMRFVATKTPEQQSCLMGRAIHVVARTALDALRPTAIGLGHGVVAPQVRNADCSLFDCTTSLDLGLCAPEPFRV